MYSILKPCNTSAAFEAIPRDRFSLDLDLCEEILGNDCTIVTNAGILLIVNDRCEVSIHKDGRLILKTDSKDLAAEQAARIAGWLEGSPAIRKHRNRGNAGRTDPAAGK
ncbi:MAG: hypothetical protein ABSG28_09605 [Methanoregula sp.]|jgi:hypothetical protein|uniref:hypothetical protein n=1 Tax=Methanoregula sp. TaxID=2052170 RepID=UPI003C137BB2